MTKKAVNSPNLHFCLWSLSTALFILFFRNDPTQINSSNAWLLIRIFQLTFEVLVKIGVTMHSKCSFFHVFPKKFKSITVDEKKMINAVDDWFWTSLIQSYKNLSQVTNLAFFLSLLNLFTINFMFVTSSYCNDVYNNVNSFCANSMWLFSIVTFSSC